MAEEERVAVLRSLLDFEPVESPDRARLLRELREAEALVATSAPGSSIGRLDNIASHVPSIDEENMQEGVARAHSDSAGQDLDSDEELSQLMDEIERTNDEHDRHAASTNGVSTQEADADTDVDIRDIEVIDLTKEQIRNDELFARQLAADINSDGISTSARSPLPSASGVNTLSSSQPSSFSTLVTVAHQFVPNVNRQEAEETLREAEKRVLNTYGPEDKRPANFAAGAHNMLASVLKQFVGAEGVDAVDRAFENKHGKYRTLSPPQQKELSKAWKEIFLETMSTDTSDRSSSSQIVTVPENDEIQLSEREMSNIRIQASAQVCRERGSNKGLSGLALIEYERRRNNIIANMVGKEKVRIAKERAPSFIGEHWNLVKIDAEVLKLYGPPGLRNSVTTQRAMLYRNQLLKKHFDGNRGAKPTSTDTAPSASTKGLRSSLLELGRAAVDIIRKSVEGEAARIFGPPHQRSEANRAAADRHVARTMQQRVEEEKQRQATRYRLDRETQDAIKQVGKRLLPNPPGGPETTSLLEDSSRSDDLGFLFGLDDVFGSSSRSLPWADQYGRAHGYTEYDRYSGRVENKENKEDLRKLLENIVPDIDMSPESREGTPHQMVYPLMEHQKVGLSWMRKMEDGSNKGGLLGDEMGLGKTIQSLALIATHPSEDPKCKTTLIVGPVALLKQWQREIEEKIKPSHRLKTFLHHGTKKATSFAVFQNYDIILTTYGMIASEFKTRIKWEESMKQDQRIERYKPKMLFLGDECVFYRIVLDEAQYIKNRDTQSAKGVSQLMATYRWALSGTPAQNNIEEFYSVIRYLRIKPYCIWDNFRVDLANAAKSHYQTRVDSAMQKLQALLRAIMLRRTKNSQIDGRSILQLPEKTVEIIHAVFSDDEKTFYSGLEAKSQDVMTRYMNEDLVGRNYANILVLLLRLRQACCHPNLISAVVMPSGDVVEIKDKKVLMAMAKKIAPDVVERLKNDTAMECPVCYDTPENATIILYCGHYCCSECIIKVIASQQQANRDAGREQGATCPQCRGELSTKKTIDYETFRAAHMQVPSAEDGSDTEVDDDTDTRDSSFDSKGKGKARARDEDTTRVKSSQRKSAERSALLGKLRDSWISSAKIEKALEILRSIRENDPSEKTIIFSQFVLLLDFMQIALNKVGLKCKRYDGSMSATHRDDAVTEFAEEPDATVMLVSLKAGNVGLNLVCASQCIIMDPFWNPFVEYQAIDRTHRIGQMRPVVVHRICIKETVEDRILALQEQKREAIENAMDENAGRNLSRLSREELGFLFGLTDMGGHRIARA